jgi:hypothetical protein
MIKNFIKINIMSKNHYLLSFYSVANKDKLLKMPILQCQPHKLAKI